MPEDGVNRVAPRRDFFVNDLDYAPFGCSWLRGITPARLGLVELLCLIFSFRQSTDTLLASPWWESTLDFVLFMHRNIAASVPMLLLVNLAERRTFHATNSLRPMPELPVGRRPLLAGRYRHGAASHGCISAGHFA